MSLFMHPHDVPSPMLNNKREASFSITKAVKNTK